MHTMMKQLIFLFLIQLACTSHTPGQYYPTLGTYIGRMKELYHAVTGDVYAVDNITVYIKGFSYDGEAPDAYFFAGNNSPAPTNKGFIIPNEKGKDEVLGPYRNRNLVLTFPITKKGQRSFYDTKWISVWCAQFSIDFGHVKYPKDLETPNAVVVDGFPDDSPGISSAEIAIVDTHTIVLSRFTYDAILQDAIFVIGSGDAEAAGSQVGNEKGSLEPLKKYKNKTLKLSIPKEARGQTVQYFGVWSPTKGMLASVTFPTDAKIPPALNALP